MKVKSKIFYNTDGSGGDPDSNPEIKVTPTETGDTGSDVKALRATLGRQIAEERRAKEEAETALKALRDADAEREKKALEAQGEYKTLAEQREAELAEARKLGESAASELKALREREEKRIKKIADGNVERLGKLPEHLQSLVPASLDPEAMADQIGQIEKLTNETDGRPGVLRGGVVPPSGPRDKKTKLAERAKYVQDIQLGRVTGAQK